EARQKLRLYTALDHPIRLKAFFLIAKNPGISFNGIRKTLKIEKGHLAYHLGILKVGGLINFEYQRKGRQTSSYNLTEAGRDMLKELANRPSDRPRTRPQCNSN
ncbi:MAG: transcriptional regulator, partial [Thaumarchaeota archaeon]|nr:transcriptional regulator [Nitrososphaerota archaeon]